MAEKDLVDADPYNDGHTHEAPHTTYVLMDTFETHVMESRCAQEHPAVAEAAERAHQALYDLYQLIGNVWHDAETAAAHKDGNNG